MKKLKIMLFMAMAVFAFMGTIFISCENDSGNESDSSTSNSQVPTEKPPAPAITSGWYSLKKTPNVVIIIDTTNSRILTGIYANYEAYKRVDSNSPETGDIISEKLGELVWIPLGTGGDYFSAYKIELNGKDWYIYDFGGSPIIETGTVSETGYNFTTGGEGLINITNIRTSRKYPEEGTYISGASTSKKIKVNNEEKYLYALVADGGKKITFYLDDSDAVTDVTSLTPFDILTDLSYDFYGTHLQAEKNDWIINRVDQGTTAGYFMVKKNGAMSSNARLIVKN
ncbi:MAG: hypothetical protein K5873_08105 [Treponema sp.]|nr:hypothetical protein [Treponema sp.]